VTEEPALTVADLRKVYAGRAVVDGLSFEAPAGRVTAVLGPNGAGKTTTIECCEGLRRPDGGTIRVLGVDPWRASAAARARVGVMLQDGGLPTGARAGEVLRHVAGLHRDPLPVAELLDRLGLAPHARTTVRRLSGGLRQRLAVAVAVVGRPDVAFLDEPSAGLDPQARLAVWDVVAQLRAGGTAVVLTTHLMDEAERLADRVVVVDHGRVVTAGSPGDLVGARGETLRFGGPAGLDLGDLVTALPAGVSVQESGPGRYLVAGAPRASLGPQAIATVTAWCAGLGVHPDGLTLGRPTLEDVFLELTGRELR
jgi:ABC-2 type transport system ATP-binding protein